MNYKYKRYQPHNKLTDKRVKKVTVFDTETAPYYEQVEPYKVTSATEPKSYQALNNTIKSYMYQNKKYWSYLTDKRQLQLIFDFGWTVADKKGNIFIKKNFLVKEIFTNMDLMKHAHYFSKYPRYLEMLQQGDIIMKSWCSIIAEFERDILEYNIREGYAFNIAFDKRAIENTHRIITKREFLFWKVHNIKTNCIWGMCAETIMHKKSYIKLAIEKGWMTPTGNISTNAENAYRYITSIYDFEESHTALDDAVIETEIMARCFKTRMKMSFGILPHPWKIVKNRAIELGLLEDKGDY